MISDELFVRMQQWDKQAFMEFIAVCVQEALKSLPLINDSIIRQAGSLKVMSQQFYKDNADLVAHKELVAKVIEQVECESPGSKFEDILRRAAPRARNVISQQYQAQNIPNASRNISSLDNVIGKL